MRELDSLLLAYMDGSATTFSAAEIAEFEAFLELPDPTVHSYLLGRSAPPDAATAALVERIRASVGSQS